MSDRVTAYRELLSRAAPAKGNAISAGAAIDGRFIEKESFQSSSSLLYDFRKAFDVGNRLRFLRQFKHLNFPDFMLGWFG